jgi:hypothetical protein
MAVTTLVSPENVPYCVNGTLTAITKYYIAQLLSAGEGINSAEMAVEVNVLESELRRFLSTAGDTALADYKAAADAEEAATWE